MGRLYINAKIMTTNPKIETERIYLRKLNLNDCSDLAKVLSDPVSMIHYGGAFSFDKVEQWIFKNTKRYETDDYGLWAMIRKSDDAFMGDCGITNQIVDGELIQEIGYHVIRNYCNMGYATESALACKIHAFKNLKIPIIYSYTRVDNLASRRVAEKIGMIETKRFMSNGHEQILYGVINKLSAQQVDAPEPATMVSPASQTSHRPAR